MKKIILIAILAVTTVSASAAELLEAIVVRVGDRIITRTQYERRLRDMYAEIDHNAPADRKAAMKEAARLGLTNELISELLIKDRADRLAITVTDAELKEAIGRLKQQYGITTDEQFEQSLASSGMTRIEMEARLRDTLTTNKV